MNTLLEAQPFYFKNYQVNSGVSSNTITSIIQDKKGFMWFGTRNGLNRFDGMSFRVFRNSIADKTSIGSNSILSLYEDNQEQLWVGTYKGIYLYDPSKESFTPFTKIPQSEIRFIEGREDEIWIVAMSTLYRYNKKSGRLKIYDHQTVNLTISEGGSIWVATATGLIRKYDNTNDKFKDFNVSHLLNVNIENQVQDIYPISDTSLFIGTMNEALLLNTKSFTANNIFKNYSWANEVQIHDIVKHSKDEYWFGTESGLYTYNLRTKKSLQNKKESENPYSLTDNVVTRFCKDAEGGTWIGTFFGGINYYSTQYNRFKKHFPHPGDNSLSGYLVHEITGDQYGNIWIGTEDAGLNKFNPLTGEIKTFLPGNIKGTLSYRNIHGLIADKDELWIGTYEHGLDVMNILTGKVVRHYSKGNKPNSLKGDFIVSLYKTRKNKVLVGTWNGMYIYNKTADNFIAHPYFNMQIQSIHEDENGTIWVASYGNGIYYYNEQTKDSGNLRYNTDNLNTIRNNYVNSLYADSKGNFWFCTESGLCRYSRSTNKVERLNVIGLTDNQVFRILEDDKGTYWVSTAKGLLKYDPSTNETTTFTTAHGLLTDQFNYNSSYKTNDGTMFFGSVKGLISFKPSEFVKNKFVPPVYITGIQINNQELPINKENSPLNKSIMYTNQITLGYDHSNITLDVAALSFALPEMNEYKYKMEGLDKEWITLSSNRKIYYTKLAPGNYTFKLRGLNSDQLWNHNERTLSIKILPPWWASWIAYALYVVALVVVIGLIIRYYLLALKEKNRRRFELLEIEKEREIHHAKVEFFTNIAHEIRTPLTLIKMPLDKLLKKQKEDKEVYENLQLMDKNTNRLIDLTNQLLDFRKAESNKFSLTFTMINITEALKEVYATFKPAAEQKNLEFRLEVPRLPLQAFVDSEAFKKIVTNLFSNAIKYAKTKVVAKLLPFGSEDVSFTIEVKNDGHLIPYHLKEKIFEPFYRIKETERELGAGIGLALSRSLAELHKGVLDLKQPQDNLNVFVLSLPIHQENEVILSEAESGVSPEAKREQVESVLDPSKATVLIVEDNKEISDYIKSEFQKEYNILTAYNGEQALEVLMKENVQVVISDIMMPVMDGIQLVKRIKTDIQYSHIPIILLTAKNTLESKIQGLEVGADAYIEKPFSLDHLRVQVNNLLTNRNLLKKHFTTSPLAQIKGIAYSKPDKDFIEKLNDMIYTNITNMDLDVDELSKMMNMSRPTLYRKIKALSDLTPNELINLTRLKKASGLLAEGTYKVTEVAHMVGYTLPTNFSRDFHKQFGVSPSQYVAGLQDESKRV